MTLADGSRVYVRCRGRTNSSNTSNDNHESKSCSLGVSMGELHRRVNRMKRTDLATKRGQLRTGGSDSNRPCAMVGNGDLWVDKHAPASFPHLLSDERTNREVLRALRAWDPYVFGRQQPSRPTSHVLYRQQQQLSHVDAAASKIGNKHEPGRPSSNPADRRPDENSRVILLSGPPGVGKRPQVPSVQCLALFQIVSFFSHSERCVRSVRCCT
jgi:chromosome transmission fidelity protein 18